METFPSLSIKPSMADFSQVVSIDPVHRANFESGATLTRTRTRSVPIKYHILYPVLSDNDKSTLESWEKNDIGYGGEWFTWIHPLTEVEYVAVLLTPIDYKVHPRSSGNKWIVAFNIAIIRENV